MPWMPLAVPAAILFCGFASGATLAVLYASATRDSDRRSWYILGMKDAMNASGQTFAWVAANMADMPPGPHPVELDDMRREAMDSIHQQSALPRNPETG